MNKRTLTIIKLHMLSLIGKNHKKAEMLRKSRLFAQFGRGGDIGILIEFHHIQN